MRYIEKGNEPDALRKWKRENANSPQNLTYASNTFPRQEVKESLLKEQGYLCGYTMLRIRIETCHIEHIEPQSKTQTSDLSISYINMLACFPQSGGDISHGFGAPIKADASVLSPHQGGIDIRFEYRRNGTVRPKDSDDIMVEQTIETLKLNNSNLTERRLVVLKRLGLTIQPITLQIRTKHDFSLVSASKAMDIANTVLKRNSSDELEEFCLAIHQCALALAKKSKARSQRIRANRNS